MNRKVYFVLHTLSIGGAERHASSIANYLANRGYAITIILLDDNKIAYELSKGIEVVCLSETNTLTEKHNRFKAFESVRLKMYKKLFPLKYQFLEKYIYLYSKYVSKLDFYFERLPNTENSIVISFMPIPNICAAVEKQKVNYKLILGEFSSPHLEFAPDAPENKMKKKYFPNADGFVFQTEEQQSFYTFLPDVKKQIIPNPIENITMHPFTGIRQKVIVNFCRLDFAKNIPLLIKSFAKIVQEYPEYKLVIYGDGPEKPIIERYIQENSITDNVELIPFANNVLELVRDSAMFVSSSNREGISNSMIEAMAIGLPVICTDCPAGGARMMIKPYENGLLVPVKDPEAMYQAMKYMIEHPDEAEKMGRNAVAIRDTLEKNKILEQWLSFIESFYEESNQ